MPCLVEVYLLIYGRATEVGRTYLLVHRASLKLVYSEKTTKFCEISTLLLSTVNTDKRKVEILKNLVAFSEYINFNMLNVKQLCQKNFQHATWELILRSLKFYYSNYNLTSLKKYEMKVVWCTLLKWSNI